MKSRIWLNTALLLAVAGLASTLYFKLLNNASSEYRLSTQKAEEINSITVDKPAALTLVKRGHDWFITRPLAARANAFQVDQLLEILSATSRQRFPANDLTRFDLDRPQALLTLGKQTFGFGALNPLTAEQYVTTADNVYLVPPRYGAAVAMPLNAFLNHLLLAENEIPTGFDLPGYKLRRVDGAWNVSPAPAELSQDQLNRFADEWHYAYSIASVPAKPAPYAEAIKIALNNGGSVTLHILQKKPELILLRDDEMIAYRFPEDVARRLLDPFAEAPKTEK
ncbi:MAG TPA: DUF4340 domain-containing protein [Burkholderiales bacterium]|nr:DUF4340 domain-containing protein [Burkholderiales bacterium]